MMLKNNVEYKVKGYMDRWTVIDRGYGYSLLESCNYGDESVYLVVPSDCEVVDKNYRSNKTGERYKLPTIITREIYETYDGIDVCLEDEGII